MLATLKAPTLATRTGVDRLTPLDLGPAALDPVVSWHGPAGLGGDRAASEATVQALSGLMEVHGRDTGAPRRIGIEVASVAAGMLACQGVLAAEVGRLRGLDIVHAETSVLEAALLLVAHHVALATCDPTPIWPEGGTAPGPPFVSADGQWFELETLDPEAWRQFWSAIGVPAGDLGSAWTSFRLRYNRGTCSLPPSLHRATAGRSMAAIVDLAGDCSVSLSPLRAYADLLAADVLPGDRPLLRRLADEPSSDGSGSGLAPGPASPPTGATGLPLEGMRVVEATNRVQGPLAGQLLRMLGAEVTLVEPPGGDPGRMGRALAGDTGAFFACFNRAKHSVELNLAEGAGRADLVELVAGADVFLHNWRPGKAAQWGLEADDLARANPRLVYAQASGWGDDDAANGCIGTDFMVQAYAGLGQGIHPQDEAPFPSRLLLSDYAGGLLACEGILTALARRERAGGAHLVDTSLLAAAMALQSHVIDDLAGGRERRRLGGRPLWGPLDWPIQTCDGVLVVGADADEGGRDACGLCGPGGPGLLRAATQASTAQRLAARPAAEGEALLLEAGIPAAVACPDVGQLATDPRFAGLFESVGGTCVAPASPWRFAAG